MRWYRVFLKSAKEQVRDYWILILVLILAPFMLFVYYLMLESENQDIEVVFVNQDRGMMFPGSRINLGDSLVYHLQQSPGDEAGSFLNFRREANREEAEMLLRSGDADVLVIIPGNLTLSIMPGAITDSLLARMELVGDITDMDYLVGAVWTEEMINRFVGEITGIRLPLAWKETPLGFSGQRSEFELYVPGLLILSIIMIMFSASAAIVREPETQTLERLKISNLTSLEFLAGISGVQVIVAVIAIALTMLTAAGLGYTLIPGTLWFILFIAFLTSLSMIAFSLIVAAICRSVKDVAIIGTFPLFLLMFFSGAAFPISGGRLLSMGRITLHFNDILSPTWAVNALHKVLVRGMDSRETLPEISALVLLTLIYFAVGVVAFRRRHMRAR